MGRIAMKRSEAIGKLVLVEGDLERSRERVTVLREEVQRQAAEAGQLREILSAREDDITKLTDEIERLRGSIATLATDILHRNEQIANLRAALEASTELLVTVLHPGGAEQYGKDIEVRCHDNRTLLNGAYQQETPEDK